MQRLVSLLLLGVLAFAQGTAAVTLRVGRYTVVGGPVKNYEDGILAKLKATTKYTITEVPLASLADRVTKLKDGSLDMVISQFTVTADRKLNVTFITPYYFGDGAALFVKTKKKAAYISLLVNDKDPAVAYAGFVGKTFCNEDGSAYNAPVAAMGLIWKKVDSQALIDADPKCDLTTSDSTATLSGYVRLVGPLVPGSTAPIGLGVPLSTGPFANKAVRIALEDASIALYTGVPGTTPIEVLNKLNLVNATPSLKGATVPLSNGAKFINNFYA